MTRLALLLAVALLAVTAAQWYLRSLATDGEQQIPTLEAVQDAPDRPLAKLEEEVEDVDEPELDIPEYIPPPVTERPRPPMGFSVDVLEIDIATPRVTNATQPGASVPEPE